MKTATSSIYIGTLTILLVFSTLSCANEPSSASYDDLVQLFKEWRNFEQPPELNGAPDYTVETFEKRYTDFQNYKSRLDDFDRTGWTDAQKADWYVVLAEMNGFDFNYRVLKPWVRDPAFYNSIWLEKSDVPAHEGPTHHRITELWTYTFPLSAEEEARLLSDIKVIAPLMEQAKTNLTGNAKELWVAGIRDIRSQGESLELISELLGDDITEAFENELSKAKLATENFISWLEEQAPGKTGPSGIGKENYTWYQQNVHLVPLTWEDEVMILKRELARAWASLKLEEQRNMGLAELEAASSPEEYDALAEQSVQRMMTFLEEKEMVTVADYFEPALREHMMSYIPAEKRNFFTIGAHYNPLPLYSHFYHWFELARMEYDPNPSPIRRGPLLYNIFDSRNEGTATAVEEIFMQAGLYDDNPRAREIVWIMLAQRAARGLGSLYAHANELTMEEAGGIHSDYTPRGWMKTEKELLLFEQHFYMRQPGYGTSYVVGKYLLEDAMAEYARLHELAAEPFVMKDFFDELNSIGNIPISLGRFQMTGDESQLIKLVGE